MWHGTAGGLDCKTKSGQRCGRSGRVGSDAV
jgi:hypothetical protein